MDTRGNIPLSMEANPSKQSPMRWAVPAAGRFPDVFFTSGSMIHPQAGNKVFFPMSAGPSPSVLPAWAPLDMIRPPTLQTSSPVKLSSQDIGDPTTSRACKSGTPMRGTRPFASNEHQSTELSLEGVKPQSMISGRPLASHVMRILPDADKNFSCNISYPLQGTSFSLSEGEDKDHQLEVQAIPKASVCTVVETPHAIGNQSSKTSSILSQRSVTGRLSSEALENLADGLAELDRVIHKIRGTTGMTSKQILARWQPPSPRLFNFWNIYQKYFHTRTAEELDRLRQEDRPPNGGKASMTTIRAAYKAFQEHEPNHESILEMFWRIQQIDGSNTTLNARHGEFLKFVNAMKRLAEAASTINGFEVAFCAAGSVVQQDQSLSATYCSPMVPKFFCDRLQLSDNEIEGHLKAHAYDYASRTTLRNPDHRNTTSSSQAGVSSTGISARDESGAAKSKGRNRSLLAVLKRKIMDLTGHCNITQFKGSRMPIREIPALLAKDGWVIENWPEEVPFLCDLTKGNGLASLRQGCRELLLEALNDDVYPVKITKKYSEAIPPSEPVIIGVPPSPESEFANGRRRFLNASQTVDRKGPARRLASSRKRGHVSERGSKGHEICDVDKTKGTSPKRRRKSE